MSFEENPLEPNFDGRYCWTALHVWGLIITLSHRGLGRVFSILQVSQLRGGGLGTL